MLILCCFVLFSVNDDALVGPSQPVPSTEDEDVSAGSSQVVPRAHEDDVPAGPSHLATVTPGDNPLGPLDGDLATAPRDMPELSPSPLAKHGLDLDHHEERSMPEL